MAHVDAACLGVDRNVVEVLRPTRGLSQRNFLDQVVPARYGRQKADLYIKQSFKGLPGN